MSPFYTPNEGRKGVQFNVRISFAAKIVVASVSETDAALRYEK
jgi:hypothetical protein